MPVRVRRRRGRRHDRVGRTPTASLPSNTPTAARDRTLLLFLYNTGARVQEAADLRIGHLALDRQASVRLHGKGDKWRTCPLWKETVEQLRRLIERSHEPPNPAEPVFRSPRGTPLTRFGIYKIVRRHAAPFDATPGPRGRRVTPHVFRHYAERRIMRSWSKTADDLPGDLVGLRVARSA